MPRVFLLGITDMRFFLALLLGISLVSPPIFAVEPTKELVGRLTNLANPVAVERLKLAAEIKSKIDKIIDERETAAIDLVQSIRSLDAADQAAKLAVYRAESEKLGLALLTPEQLKLLDQWEYELRGPLAFQDRDLAELLKITSEQQTKIATAIKDFEANTPVALRKGRQIELERQLINQLSPEQKMAWGKLIGRSIGSGDSATAAVEASPAKPLEIIPTKPAAPAAIALTDSKPSEAESKATETKQPEVSPPTTVKTEATKGGTVPPGEKKLRFSFKFQPWREVIEWFAQQNDYSLVMEVAPPGTFNYQDSRSYTPAEALDLLNSILQTKGYTLVRRERLLMLVNLQDGIPPNLVESITPEQLDKRAQYELVSVLFRVERLTPDKAASEIRALLGPQGSIAILNELRTIQVTDTVGRLRTVRNVIDAVERPSNAANDNFKPLALKNITPAEALTIVKQLLNIPVDRNATTDGSIRLFADNTNKAILVGAKPEAIAKVEEILALVDVPNGSGNAALEGAPQLEVYSIGAADPDTVLSVLQTLLSGNTDVRLSKDPRNGNLIALARPSLHATIRATIDQLQKDARQLEVFRLRMLDPTLVKEAIVKLYGDGNDPAHNNAPKVEVDPNLRQVMVRGTATQLTQIKQLLDKMGEGDLTASGSDSTSGSTMQILPLTGRAANSVLGQLEQIWPNVHKNKIRVVTSSQLNSSSSNGATQFPPYDLIQQKRVVEPVQEPAPIPAPAAPIPFQPAPATGNNDDGLNKRILSPEESKLLMQMLLERQLQPNIIPPGSQTAPVQPQPAQPQPETTPSEEPQTKPIKNRSAQIHHTNKFQFVAHQAPIPAPAATNPAPATTAEKKAEAAASGELPPINISVGPAGLVITCDDPKVLEDFVSLVKTLASRQNGAQREYTVYYLKYAKAQIASELLNQIFSAGGSSSSSGGGGGLMNSLAGAAFGDVGGGLVGSLLGFGGGGGSGDTPAKLSGSGTITIVPETRLNALFIQANPTDLEMLEQILKVIDQAQSPEDVTVINKPRLIPVVYTTAEEVAAVVKQVYADRMSPAGGGQQRQPNPEDFIRALRGGGGGRGGGNDSRRQAEETQKMTIGIDTRTNSLVVTAPEPLFNEVKSLVAQLDQEQPAGTESMRIVTLKNASPAAVQQALTQIVGPEYLKGSKPAGLGTSTTTSAIATTAPRSNRTMNAQPQQQFGGGNTGFDARAMQQLMQGGGGGGRGNRGGGGGGGFGGGGFGGGGGGGRGGR
jgi:type II secretory pathway component GspD/PulD (secretin)